MATLATDKYRVMELTGMHPEYNEIPVIAADIIYGGAAVGDNASGLARPLVALDPFLGFCDERADNSAGAASAILVKVKEQGFAKLAVVGATGTADVGEPVYAIDDDSFTLTALNNTPIGKVKRWISGTTCLVHFQAVNARSI